MRYIREIEKPLKEKMALELKTVREKLTLEFHYGSKIKSQKKERENDP